MNKLFSKAIVNTPSKSMVNGLTSANLGIPDYNLALIQHQNYIDALTECGVEVIVLKADENYPDSTFVEDTALLTSKCAVITNPGAVSRKKEIVEMEKCVSRFYSDIEYIKVPGTLEGGDVMMVGNHFYIGISGRTNETGAEQLIAILNKYSMTGSKVFLKNVLHLKTGVAYLENNTIAITGEFIHELQFQNYKHIIIPTDESYAANCIWVNDKVLIPKGFPKSLALIKNAGYEVIEVDVSEFQKLDGGLSCLSLRF